MTKVLRFLHCEDGPTSVEYAVMMALIIAVCIGAITLTGGQVSNLWGSNRDNLGGVFGG